MSTKTTTWTIAQWSERTTATYVPVNTHINNVTIDAYGRRADQAHYLDAIPRRPYRIEESDGTAYIMYEDDNAGPVPIIRITEETAAASDAEEEA